MIKTFPSNFQNAQRPIHQKISATTDQLFKIKTMKPKRLTVSQDRMK
jgi:hypothetical protein